MKLKFHYFHLLPVLAAGMMVSPLAAQSPDRGTPPGGEAPREAPRPDRIQAAVRQIAELHQAGKHDEARVISERLHEAAKSNPEVAKQISEALRRQRPESKPDARRPDAPRADTPRPNAAEAPKHPEMRPTPPQAPKAQPQPPQVSRPNAQRAQAAPQGKNFNMPWPNPMQSGGHPMMSPNMGQGQNPAMGWQQMMQQPNRRMMPPHMPQGPGPQMHPNMGQARGHQMMPQGMAQGRQNAMRAPFQLQARQHLMQQRFSPQGRGAAMAMRMQFRKHLMQQPYLQHGRNSAMRQFMQMRGGARPMMGPNAAGQPQCPKMRPNAAGQPQCPQMRPNAAGPKPQVVRPKMEAAKHAAAATGDVAKIRHLRQAAEHLDGAGLAEHAAKARAEADRMTAALKAQPQAVKPQVKPTQAQPKPDGKPDVNAAILGELKKMGRQMEEMNARVRKLEAQEKAVR